MVHVWTINYIIILELKNTKVTGPVDAGAAIKITLPSEPSFPWLSPWKTTQPISFTDQEVTQNVKIREVWGTIHRLKF